MKLIYEKPLVAVENYALAQTISSCQNKVAFTDFENCIKNDPDITDEAKDLIDMMGLFLNGPCPNPAEGEDKYDGICYNTNANAMFNS